MNRSEAVQEMRLALGNFGRALPKILPDLIVPAFLCALMVLAIVIFFRAAMSPTPNTPIYSSSLY